MREIVKKAKTRNNKKPANNTTEVRGIELNATELKHINAASKAAKLAPTEFIRSLVMNAVCQVETTGCLPLQSHSSANQAFPAWTIGCFDDGSDMWLAEWRSNDEQRAWSVTQPEPTDWSKDEIEAGGTLDEYEKARISTESAQAILECWSKARADDTSWLRDKSGGDLVRAMLMVSDFNDMVKYKPHDQYISFLLSLKEIIRFHPGLGSVTRTVDCIIRGSDRLAGLCDEVEKLQNQIDTDK